jgi:hypothetical protein
VAQQLAFATPGTEEMTKTAIAMGGGLVTGLAEGVIVSMAPSLGALATPLTWGTLIAVPVVGVAGALFTKGMIGDFFQGIAGAGAGVLGYCLPGLVKPYLPTGAGKKTVTGNDGVKQLGMGAGSVPQRQQAAARVGMEF